MKELAAIWEKRLFETERSYTRDLMAAVPPQSYAVFGEHAEFDEVFRLWTQDWPWYGLDKARLWGLVLNLKRTLSRRTGAVAEIGVYKGNCASVLAHYARRFGRALYLCDTFDGFDPRQFERDMGPGKESAFKDTSLAVAKGRVGNYPDVRWVVGMFPDSLTDEMREDRYAFVHLDCDIYEPTAAGLTFFWPRLTPGGVIFVHDYGSGHWPGATRAVEEFVASAKVEGVLLPDAAGSILFAKPG